jgi:peptidoglycan hydrolase CwlO-like protein
MKKKIGFLVSTIFLSVSWLVVGCGIPQEDYDAVVAQLNSAQVDLQSTKAELQKAQANISDLNSKLSKSEDELKAEKANSSEITSSLEQSKKELEEAQTISKNLSADLEKVQSDFTAFKSELKSMFGPLQYTISLNTDILGINAGLCLDDLDVVEKNCYDVDAKVTSIPSEDLKARWDAAFTITDNMWNLSFAPFERFMATHNARLTSIVDRIADKLNE